MSNTGHLDSFTKIWSCFSPLILPVFFGLTLFTYKKKNDDLHNDSSLWFFWVMNSLTIVISIISIVLFGIELSQSPEYNKDGALEAYLVSFLFSSFFLVAVFVFFITELFEKDYSEIVRKIKTFFSVALDFFITTKISDFWRKGIYIGVSLLTLIPLIFFSLIPALQDHKNMANWVKFAISTIFILFMLFVSLGLISTELKNKYTFKLLKIMMYRKNITWTVFFISFLSFGIPFLINNRKHVEKTENEELFKCKTGKRIKPEGEKVTVERTCKESVFDESKENINMVEIPFYIVLFLMLSLLFGLNTGKIKNIFNIDPFKSLIISLCLGLFLSFIVFQIHSDRFFGINDEVKEVSDKAYKTGNIIFLIFGLIGLVSLKQVNSNYSDRPNYDDLMKNIFWLFEKLKSDLFSSALYIVGLIAFTSVFYTLLSKRSIDSGITTKIVQLVYLMVGLSLMIMLYKVLINTEFMKRFPIFKILINLIFFIPCILFGIVEFLYNDFTNTPKVVYVLLLGQMILISSYILIPLIVKNLYGLVKIKKSNNEVNELEKQTTKKSVNQKTKEINELKQVVSDKISEKKWNKIIGEKLYKDINKLQVYLVSNTNIKDEKGYINESVKEKVKEKLEPEKTEEILKKINENPDLWATNCDAEWSNCEKVAGTIDAIDKLDCNLAYYTIYIHLVGEEISNKIGELTKLETKNKKAEEKDKKYFNTNTTLISDPVYLDRETATDKKFQDLEDCIKDVKDCNRSYNYAISLWVNLHAQPPNNNPSYNKYANIINYSKNPKISYNMKENKLKVEILRRIEKIGGSDSSSHSIFEKNVLKMQKWNNIVINYNLGIVEIFVNSKLVASNDVILPYLITDDIIIGEKNGISGGICNVVYYPTKLTKTEIDLLYNSLKLRNPPIA